MSKDINKKAFEQAEKELLDKKVEQIKGYILSTLEAIEIAKEEKRKAEEKLRILKLDLDDARNGKFDKIDERQQKSIVAKEFSVPVPNFPLVSQHSINLTGINKLSDLLLTIKTSLYFISFKMIFVVISLTALPKSKLISPLVTFLSICLS